MTGTKPREIRHAVAADDIGRGLEVSLLEWPASKASHRQWSVQVRQNGAWASERIFGEFESASAYYIQLVMR